MNSNFIAHVSGEDNSNLILTDIEFQNLPLSRKV